MKRTRDVGQSFRALLKEERAKLEAILEEKKKAQEGERR